MQRLTELELKQIKHFAETFQFEVKPKIQIENYLFIGAKLQNKV